MREVDGWDEAVDLIDEDDVKRWNADPKMDTQKFKSALNLAVTSQTMKSHLFADNVAHCTRRIARVKGAEAEDHRI